MVHKFIWSLQWGAGRKVCKLPKLRDTTSLLDPEMEINQQSYEPINSNDQSVERRGEKKQCFILRFTANKIEAYPENILTSISRFF